MKRISILGFLAVSAIFISKPANAMLLFILFIAANIIPGQATLDEQDAQAADTEQVEIIQLDPPLVTNE